MLSCLYCSMQIVKGESPRVFDEMPNFLFHVDCLNQNPKRCYEIAKDTKDKVAAKK